MRLVFLLAVLVLLSGCVQESVKETATTLSVKPPAETTSTVITSTTIETATSSTAKPTNQIANPASVYCIQHGGTLRIVTDADGGQRGVCTLPAGVECDEWAYLRGECPQAHVTATTILKTMNCTEMEHPIPSDCAKGYCPRTGARCRYMPGNLYKPAECRCV